MELQAINFILLKNALNPLENRYFKLNAVSNIMQQLNMKSIRIRKIIIKKMNLKKNLKVFYTKLIFFRGN